MSRSRRLAAPAILPTFYRMQIPSDTMFARAVDLIDAGDVDELSSLLTAHPDLLTATVELEDHSPGSYFARPRLLWFIAENPVRNGRMAPNVVALVECLLSHSEKRCVCDLVEQASSTLSLVASGRVARESGHQEALIRALVAAGADPNAAVRPAAAHRETAAITALHAAGAEMTLILAAALGDSTSLTALVPSATQSDLQDALSVAAINDGAEAVRTLIVAGADPNRFNPPGLHPHTPPLHQAVYWSGLQTVRALVEGGAALDVRDKHHNATPLDWARHGKREEIADYLDTCDRPPPSPA